MAYSKVERSTWHDERFRTWARNTREVWFYLMTSPHMDRAGGRIGCYVLDPMYAAADLSTPDYRWTPEMVEEELQRLDEEHGRIIWDPTARLVLLRQFFRHNRPENPNVALAAAKDVGEIPYSETLLKGLISAATEHLPNRFDRGQPCGDAIIDAAQARLERHSEKPHGRAVFNPSERVAQTLPEELPQHFPKQEHEQEQEQEHIPVVAASPPQPARVREESSPPAAAAAAVAVVEVNQDPPEDHSEHLQAMRQIVDATADTLGDDLARRRLTGELELLITGDDVTAWQDARGDAVPWADRPRLLRLALKRWELDRATYPKPRSALLYVIAQQLDPRPTPSISREAETEHYARHRDGAARRPASEPAAVGGLVGIDARPADEPVDQSAQEWARNNQDAFSAILSDIATAEGLDLDQTLDRIRATGLALQQVRKEVLAS